MAVLEALPDELFAQILEDLPNRDLASTSLVSRRLRNIAQPLLYREPHLLINDQHPTSLDLIFITLLTPGCEYLGTHVRCLTVDWRSHHLRDDYSDLPILVAARARSLLGNTPLSEITQVVLLLQLMPRLQSLLLPLLHEPGCPTSRPTPLRFKTLPPTLRDFTYEWQAPNNLIDHTNLLTILSLPRIRSIVLRDISNNYFIDPERTVKATCKPGTSSLTHLTMRSGDTAQYELQSILVIPRALTHFVYQPSFTSTGFMFAAFGVALRSLRHSLTSLHVDLRMIRPRWQRHLGIGSLRDWPALRTVTCTLDLLFESNSYGLAALLPAGIRELEILEDAYMPVGEAVRMVVAVLRATEMVPELERVRVYAGRRKTKRLRRMLRKACWKVGVAFEDGDATSLGVWCE